MAHRKTTPICKHCGMRPAKVYMYFCTMRCAAEEGQRQMFYAGHQWCDRCGEWHDPVQKEDCEDDEIAEGEKDEEDYMLRTGW